MSKSSYLVVGADGSEHILGADEIQQIRQRTVAPATGNTGGPGSKATGTPAMQMQELLNEEFTSLTQMIAVIMQQLQSASAKYPQTMKPIIASLNNLSAEVSNCRSNLPQQLLSTGVGPATPK